MPPRFSYWTITIDNQPTAFRAREVADIMPTFKRLKERHPSALLMWFERGRLWPSREDAVAALRRKDRRAPGPPAFTKAAAGKQDLETSRPPRSRSWRPGGEHRDPRQKYQDARKARWQRFKQRIRGKGRRDS